MKFLLVYPNVIEAVQEQLGISYLAGQLENEGLEVRLFDSTFDLPKKFEQLMLEWKPLYVGVSVRTSDIKFGLQLAKRAHKLNPNPEIFIGGVGATLDPWPIVAKDYVDAVFLGESDKSLLEFIKGKPVPGVIETNSVEAEQKIYSKPKLPDVNVLAPPDHGMWQKHFGKEFHGNKGTLGMFLTSRGCPFDCNYCCNKALKKISEGKWVRYRNPELVYKEIQWSKEKFGMDHFYIADDTFTSKLSHTYEMCEVFHEIGLPWYCMTNASTVNSDIFNAMAEAGCAIVLMGIESGSERIRRDILNRQVSNEQIVKAFHAAKMSGIKTISFNMVGMPSETQKDFEDTIRLNKLCNVDDAKMTLFTALPGTTIWNDCKLKGLLSDEFPVNYYESTNIRLPEWNVGDLLKMQEKFRSEVRNHLRIMED